MTILTISRDFCSPLYFLSVLIIWNVLSSSVNATQGNQIIAQNFQGSVKTPKSLDSNFNSQNSLRLGQSKEEGVANIFQILEELSALNSGSHRFMVDFLSEILLLHQNRKCIKAKMHFQDLVLALSDQNNKAGLNAITSPVLKKIQSLLRFCNPDMPGSLLFPLNLEQAGLRQNEFAWRPTWRILNNSLLQGKSTNFPFGTYAKGWLDFSNNSLGFFSSESINQSFIEWKNTWPEHPVTKTIEGEWISRNPSSIIKKLAIILPLTGSLGSAGKAIQEGILTSVFMEGRVDIEIQFFDSGARTIPEIFNRVLAFSPNLVIGPLTKTNTYTFKQLNKNKLSSILLNYTTIANSNTEATIALPEAEIVQTTQKKEGKKRKRRNRRNKNEVKTTPRSKTSKTTKISKRKVQLEVGLKEDNDLSTILDLIARSHKRPNVLLFYSISDRYQNLANNFFEKWPVENPPIKSIPFENTSRLDLAVKEGLHINHSESRQTEVRRVLNRQITFTSRKRKEIDVIVLLAEPGVVHLVKPAINFYHGNDIPLVTISSGVTDKFTQRRKISDIEGLIFTSYNLRANKDPILRQFGDSWEDYPTQKRNFLALGADAFRLTLLLEYSNFTENFQFSGASGNFVLNKEGKFHIYPSLFQVKNGNIVTYTDGL